MVNVLWEVLQTIHDDSFYWFLHIYVLQVLKTTLSSLSSSRNASLEGSHPRWSTQTDQAFFLFLICLVFVYPRNHTSSITPTTTKFKSKMAMIIIILTPKKIYGIYPLHYATLCKGSSMFVLYITIITTNTVVIITVIINNIIQRCIFADKKRLLMELWAEAPPWLSSGTPRSKPTSRCRMSLSPALSPSKSLFSSPYFVITLKIKNYYEAMFEQHQYYILHCQ